MKTIKRLPKNYRFVKQDGYKKGWFHNWAIFVGDKLISLGGKTKKQAREICIKSLNFNQEIRYTSSQNKY